MRDLRAEAGRRWRQAVSDFSFLPVAKKTGKHDTCCFLAQQTAEKALKAFLFSQGEELILTHSRFKLCDMAARYSAEIRSLKEQVELLDFYYVEARYPTAMEDVIPSEFYSEEDSTQAISMAEIVIRTVEKYFGSTSDKQLQQHIGLG
jgi:HEPN domain-containing protein